MSDFTLNIPEHLIERARKLALNNQRPLEDLLIDQLEHALSDPFALLPQEEREAIQALRSSSDTFYGKRSVNKCPMTNRHGCKP